MGRDFVERSKAKGIYLLPNLLTTASLFAGFYAIIAAMKGDVVYAAMAIFIAMVFDNLDGRVARLTNTESAFGAQYDSLSDMVVSGLAPAVLSYSWGLHSLGKLGWLVAFFYAAATALRLARFNTQIGKVNKKYFIGLPCPAASSVVTGMVWSGFLWTEPTMFINVCVALVTILVALLMVSPVRYYSFKELDFKKRVPFITVFLIVLIFVGVAINPPLVLFGTFLVYGASGPWMWIRRWGRLRKVKKKPTRSVKKIKKD